MAGAGENEPTQIRFLYAPAAFKQYRLYFTGIFALPASAYPSVSNICLTASRARLTGEGVKHPRRGRVPVGVDVSWLSGSAKRLQNVRPSRWVTKRAAGNAYGSTPFGYVRDGTALVVVPHEQDALREAVRMDREGASYREIAAMLAARGAQPKRGAMWHASSVLAMLRSKIVAETFAA
jgi:Recombinase